MEERVLGLSPWLSVGPLFFMPVSIVSVWCLSPTFSFVKDMCPTGLGVYPIQCDLLLTNWICNNPLSK